MTPPVTPKVARHTPDGAQKSRLVVDARGTQPLPGHDVTISGQNNEGTPSVLHLSSTPIRCSCSTSTTKS